MRRYPSSKVKSNGSALLEQPEEEIEEKVKAAIAEGLEIAKTF